MAVNTAAFSSCLSCSFSPSDRLVRFHEFFASQFTNAAAQQQFFTSVCVIALSSRLHFCGYIICGYEQAGYKSYVVCRHKNYVSFTLVIKAQSRTTSMTNHFSELFHRVAILVLKNNNNGKRNKLFCITHTHPHTHTQKSLRTKNT